MFRPPWLRLMLISGVVLRIATGTPALASPGPQDRNRTGDRLIVHEWGTFTSLQDETGRAIPGINTDDEPLPKFVHRLADQLIIKPSDLAPVYYKGVPRVHRDVTMRLETPVIYFYPPSGSREPFTVDVRVGIRGGWLTEYYPNARVDAPGVQQGSFRFGSITPRTIGQLEWTGLRIGGDPPLLPTDSHVWLAPRETRAAAVQTPEHESERYVFYRGVGNLAAPLQVTRDAARDTLAISEQFDPALLGSQSGEFSTMLWLADIRSDGAVAYRSIGNKPLSLRRGEVVATTDATFEISDYAHENLTRLRAEMHEALVENGLYAEEAAALLSTWELGYFKSPGMRVFFLLPQQWTDAVLPLDISVPAEITRTMVGRIELVTPRHRELMQRISSERNPDLSWFYAAHERQSPESQVLREVWEGKARLRDAKIAVPKDYQAYVDLGRFRNALILDELARKPASDLDVFAKAYHLHYFDPDE